jgi:hypothetical protein
MLEEKEYKKNLPVQETAVQHKSSSSQYFAATKKKMIAF